VIGATDNLVAPTLMGQDVDILSTCNPGYYLCYFRSGRGVLLTKCCDRDADCSCDQICKAGPVCSYYPSSSLYQSTDTESIDTVTSLDTVTSQSLDTVSSLDTVTSLDTVMGQDVDILSTCNPGYYLCPKYSNRGYNIANCCDRDADCMCDQICKPGPVCSYKLYQSTNTVTSLDTVTSVTDYQQFFYVAVGLSSCMLLGLVLYFCVRDEGKAVSSSEYIPINKHVVKV